METNKDNKRLETAIDYALFLTMHTEYPILLAGGAVRDRLNGRGIKDFDFFVNAAAKQDLVKHTAYVFKKVSIDYYEDMDVEVYNFPTIQLGKDGMQFIFTNIPPEIYIQKYFDIGLCKCWINVKEGILHTTVEYEKDVRDCTISVQCDDRFNPLHIKRVQNKYPHHNVILNNDHFGLYRKLYENSLLITPGTPT